MSDYISRDKVAQAFEDADVDVCEDYGEYYGCEWGFSRDAVRKIVAELPAADVAPVEHGHWNDINPAVLKPGISWVCRCSLCGCPQDYKHNYCPNCGCCMLGGGEDDTVSDKQ